MTKIEKSIKIPDPPPKRIIKEDIQFGLKKKEDITEKIRGGVIRGKVEAEIKCNGSNDDPMFIGLDPSYDGFGLILLDHNANILEEKLIKSTKNTEADLRIIQLEEEFKFIPSILALHSVCIEGLSLASKGLYALQLAALHYYIRIFLLKNNINFKVIAPGTLKKFVADHGHAKKELMLLKTYKKWGVEFDNNNLCDAYGLARMALEEFNNGKNQPIKE